MIPITNASTKTTAAIKDLGLEGSFLESQLEGVTVCDKSIDSLALMSKSRNFSKTKILMKANHFFKRVPNKSARDDTMKFNDRDYDLTPEIQKALTTKNDIFRKMNEDSLLTSKVFLKEFQIDVKEDTLIHEKSLETASTENCITIKFRTN